MDCTIAETEWNVRDELRVLYSIQNRNPIKKVMHLLKCYLRTFRKWEFQIDNSQEIAFLWTDMRVDHAKMYKKIYDACKESKTLCRINKKNRISFADVVYLFRCSKRYKSPIIVQCQENSEQQIRCAFVDRLIMKATWLEYQKAILLFQKCDYGRVHCFVVHNDLWLCESALIRYANSTGKITIVAEHALCPVNVTDKSIHVLNYWRSPSHYLMAWGESSAKLYKRYSPQLKVGICGNPMVEKHNESVLKGSLGIILDIPENAKENRMMIEIVQAWAKSAKFHVRVRIHPTDNIASYKIDESITSFNGDIETAEFLVGHTSTMLITCLAEGKKVFKYQSEMPFYELPSDVCFCTVDELARCINGKRDMNFASMAIKHIDCIGNESMNKYTAFFKRIRNENWS